MTPCTVAYQVPLSMEFSRQEYWNGLPFLSSSPEDLPTQGSNLALLHCMRTLYHLSHQGSPAFIERGKILLKAWILESGRNLPILCSATVTVWPWTFHLKFFNTPFPVLWNGHNYSVHLVVSEDNAGEVCLAQKVPGVVNGNRTFFSEKIHPPDLKFLLFFWTLPLSINMVK